MVKINEKLHEVSGAHIVGIDQKLSVSVDVCFWVSGYTLIECCMEKECVMIYIVNTIELSNAKVLNRQGRTISNTKNMD